MKLASTVKLFFPRPNVGEWILLLVCWRRFIAQTQGFLVFCTSDFSWQQHSEIQATTTSCQRSRLKNKCTPESGEEWWCRGGGVGRWRGGLLDDSLLMATVRSHDPPLRWAKRIQGSDVIMGGLEVVGGATVFYSRCKNSPQRHLSQSILTGAFRERDFLQHGRMERRPYPLAALGATYPCNRPRKI